MVAEQAEAGVELQHPAPAVWSVPMSGPVTASWHSGVELGMGREGPAGGMEGGGAEYAPPPHYTSVAMLEGHLEAGQQQQQQHSAGGGHEEALGQQQASWAPGLQGPGAATDDHTLPQLTESSSCPLLQPQLQPPSHAHAAASAANCCSLPNSAVLSGMAAAAAVAMGPGTVHPDYVVDAGNHVGGVSGSCSAREGGEWDEASRRYSLMGFEGSLGLPPIGTYDSVGVQLAAAVASLPPSSVSGSVAGCAGPLLLQPQQQQQPSWQQQQQLPAPGGGGGEEPAPLQQQQQHAAAHAAEGAAGGGCGSAEQAGSVEPAGGSGGVQQHAVHASA